MKRAGLLVALLADACAATPTPGREELAEALGRYSGSPTAPIALVHIGCQAISGQQAVFACRWRQQEGRYWRSWQSRLALTEQGWRIVGQPVRRP